MRCLDDDDDDVFSATKLEALLLDSECFIGGDHKDFHL